MMFPLSRYLGVWALLLCSTVGATNASAGSEVAERFAAAINAADAAALNALVDVDALATRVTAGMDPESPQRVRYLAHLQKSAATIGATLAAQLSAANTTAKVVGASAKGPLVMITMTRADGSVTGHNYYRLRTGADGRLEDWYDYALAMWTSDSLRFTSAGLLPLGDLAALFFEDRKALQAAGTMRLVGTHLSMADHAGAYQALQNLPEDVRRERAFATFAMVLSRSVGMDTYRENLARLAETHGADPELQFTLLDHYLLASEFEAALVALDGIERELGRDEVVLVNRGIALMGLRRFDEALAACDEALALDPKYDNALWTRVTLGLEKSDAALVVESLLGVEQATGTRIDMARLSEREAYAGVRDTPEFKALLAQRAAK